MKLESQRRISAGINFVVTPFVYTRRIGFDFQIALSEIDSQLSNFEILDTKFTAIRLNPTPLQIQLAPLGPGVGQLLIIADQAIPSFDSFLVECDLIAQAFTTLVPHPKQIITCDSTVRDIYETSNQHAFQEIWEGQLHQRQESLNIFGRPILGGGVRLVLPAIDEENDSQIDLKIESFLQDSKKIFIEAQFVWQRQSGLGVPIDPSVRLTKIHRFITTTALEFLKDLPNDNARRQ